MIPEIQKTLRISTPEKNGVNLSNNSGSLTRRPVS